MDVFNTRNTDEVIFSNQEQIYDFYETLRNGSVESVEQFQSILEVFVCDILKHRKEIKRLEESYKREKETNERYLRNIEEEQERDMKHLEEKIRDEEQRKFDLERESIQQRTTKEINDLQQNLQRLQTIEQLYSNRKNEIDNSVVVLREEIAKLTEENQSLNTALNNSLTSNAILQSDLQSVRSQLNERQTMLLQEKQSSSSNHRERESLQTNVRQLVEVNKQLRDENDSLRAMIESRKLLISPPEMLPSPKRLMSGTGSTLGAYWNNSRLDSPSPSYINKSRQLIFDSFDLESMDELDSGLSLTTARDATEMESEQEHRVLTPLINQQQTAMTNFRPLIVKRDDQDSDSDEVFVEIPLDRNNPKRQSRTRPTRKAIGNPHSSPKPSPTLNRLAATKSPGTSLNLTVSPSPRNSDLPFDRMYKVVFCGDAAVGKSSLIMRLCKGKFSSTANSTLGVDFQNKQIDVDGSRVAMQLWDTAGQERFRSVAKSYFRRCDGVILVYDATYERSFLNVREWIDTISDSTPKKVSVMIVANKIDLRDQMRNEGKRVIECAEGIRLAKEYNALFIETSAKDGTNSIETLVELARDMQCNEDLERFRTAGINLDKSTKKSTCC